MGIASRYNTSAAKENQQSVPVQTMEKKHVRKASCGGSGCKFLPFLHTKEQNMEADEDYGPAVAVSA